MLGSVVDHIGTVEYPAPDLVLEESWPDSSAHTAVRAVQDDPPRMDLAAAKVAAAEPSAGCTVHHIQTAC